MTAPAVAGADRWERLRVPPAVDERAAGQAQAGDARRRLLHPLAWWAWALVLATAAMRTTNPLLGLLVIAVCAFVVSARRTTAPWSRSFALALRLGLILVVLRMVLACVFAVRVPGNVVFTLPEAELPAWAAGVSVGGSVTVELLARAFAEGVRLAAIVACAGAANALASPRRLLRSLPAVLYEAGVAVTVALSFVPEVVEQLARLRDARRLRGRPSTGIHALRGLALPVLEGGLDGAVSLAASMDARGYGRRGDAPARTRHVATAALCAGLLGVAMGSYSVLDASAPRALGLPVMAIGSLLLVSGLVLAGRRSPRTIYRPDVWRWRETAVAVSGVPAVLAMTVAASGDPEAVDWAATLPMTWPPLPLVAVAGILLATLPAWVAPRLPWALDPTTGRADGAGAAT